MSRRGAAEATIVHGKKPACTQCHKPHAETMTATDCSTCHKAHQPKNVAYPATVSNAMCGACHKKPAALVAATLAAARHNAGLGAA